MMQFSRHILPGLSLLAALSCTPEPLSFSGRPHFWHPTTGGETVAAWPSGDTLVYVCTVSYPAGFDWRADSTDRKEDGRIRLFANGRPVLELETGAGTGLSPEGDLHHLIGGHLYSEGFRDGQTLLLRDGTPLLRFTGREKLCGYLTADGDDYSLWRDRDGEGFSFRKNADVLLRRESGRPFGDFGDTGNGIHGALTLSGGSVCFSYQMPIGSETGCFLCISGSEILLKKGEGLQFLDARLLAGKTWTVFRDGNDITWLSDGQSAREATYFGQLLWQDARVTLRSEQAALLGNARIGKGKLLLYVLYAPDGSLLFGGTGICLPVDEAMQYILGYSSGGLLRLRRGMSATQPFGGTLLWESGESVYFPSGACASALGERIFIGVSPLGGGKCYLWAGEKLGEWEINGYICAVEALLSPPS